MYINGIIIAGPTASGKTKIAKKISTKFPSTIINADSMQVYEDLQIITNRPSNIEISKFNYKLFGVLKTPTVSSLGWWVQSALKEIKMRPVTETHDYEFKVKNAKKFIAKGDKVKFTIRFKGRELQHSHLGNELMAKIKEDMKDIGKVELHPKFDGKQMIMVMQPL